MERWKGGGGPGDGFSVGPDPNPCRVVRGDPEGGVSIVLWVSGALLQSLPDSEQLEYTPGGYTSLYHSPPPGENAENVGNIMDNGGND